MIAFCSFLGESIQIYYDYSVRVSIMEAFTAKSSKCIHMSFALGRSTYTAVDSESNAR